MIHAYKQNGYNIILDVHSGSIHAVDCLAYYLITNYEGLDRATLAKSALVEFGDDGISQADIDETLEDIEALIGAKKLFSKSGYGAFVPKRSTDVVKALCLHISHSCNLNCAYCFASQGKYNGERALMSFEVGKKALDFLLENSGTRRNLEVDFFGGEPLMNMQVVKQLVSYAREQEKIYDKVFRFTLTTNGVLLNDETMDYLNQEMNNVVLSLDGRREVNDRLRRTYTDEGSYDIIVPKFQEFVRRRGGKGYYMRGTFTHFNTDFLTDIKHMADLGFTELSMEPVVGPSDSPDALTTEDLPVLFDQYEHLALEMLERKRRGEPLTFYHYMIDLSHGPCLHKRVAGCGSGTEYLSVTPWGDLYPCHQFVGNEDFKMGTVDDGVTNKELLNEFAGSTLFSKSECQGCWAQLYCSGGCAANSYNTTGSINGIYEYGCELFKKRIECAIMMQVADANAK